MLCTMAQQLEWDFEKPFWHQDVRVLVRSWLNGAVTLLQVLLVFAMLAVPIVVPALVLWALKTFGGFN